MSFIGETLKSAAIFAFLTTPMLGFASEMVRVETISGTHSLGENLVGHYGVLQTGNHCLTGTVRREYVTNPRATAPEGEVTLSAQAEDNRLSAAVVFRQSAPLSVRFTLENPVPVARTENTDVYEYVCKGTRAILSIQYDYVFRSGIDFKVKAKSPGAEGTQQIANFKEKLESLVKASGARKVEDVEAMRTSISELIQSSNVSVEEVSLSFGEPPTTSDVEAWLASLSQEKLDARSDRQFNVPPSTYTLSEILN